MSNGHPGKQITQAGMQELHKLGLAGRANHQTATTVVMRALLEEGPNGEIRVKIQKGKKH